MGSMERLTIDLSTIRAALTRDLPGAAAQYRMAPGYRSQQAREGIRWREAAVLVLLYPKTGQLYFPLTLRPDDLPHHKGQVSLPGGAREGDETLSSTALRETREELGVEEDRVTVLGALSPLEVPPSGFRIQPFVGSLPFEPLFAPAKGEVSELIETPLVSLLDPARLRSENRNFDGKTWAVPYYEIGSHIVWGATAMILAEFAALLQSELSSNCVST